MASQEDTRPGAERVLDAVAASPRGATASAIASATGLHVTTVRFHLDRLADAGRVTSRPHASGGRGRPSRLYEVVRIPDARAGMLAALAKAAASDSGSPPMRAQLAGEAWAQEWADELDADDPRPMRDVLAEVFGQLGFSPQSSGEGLALKACPFFEEAVRHPDVVCGVHRGLALGIARSAGAAVELVPFAPGGCRLTVE